jgi:hypothetical protein
MSLDAGLSAQPIPDLADHLEALAAWWRGQVRIGVGDDGAAGDGQLTNLLHPHGRVRCSADDRGDVEDHRNLRVTGNAILIARVD